MKYFTFLFLVTVLLNMSSSCGKKIIGAAASEFTDSISVHTSDLVRRYGTTISSSDQSVTRLGYHLDDLKKFMKDKRRPRCLHKLLYQYYQYANTLRLLSLNSSLNLAAFANTLSMLNQVEAKLAIEIKK